MQSGKEKWSHGLLFAALMSVGFIILSFVPTWGDLQSALFGGRVVESTLSSPIWGSRLGLRLLGFVSALIAVHLALALTGWLLGHASRRAFPNVSNGVRSWTCCWVLVLTGWVLMANAAWFPNSKLGAPYHEIVQAQFGPVEVFQVSTALIVVMGIYVISVSVGRVLATFRRRSQLALGAASLLVAIALPIMGSGHPPRSERTERPHIIVIGIDSLRTDFVRNDAIRLTPSIDEFLSRAAIFSDTVTPLARTFPAWVSIVSGRHPHSTGAIINLFPRDFIDEGDTLPEVLRQTGYRAIYAIDEVRFSNLDETYGFDSMISPPIGSADFLLGYLNDFPLSNLIVNTALGRMLFPFAHGNRAAVSTYDPDTFVDLLGDDLRFDEPTFLAVHLTLPHWPYGWATSPRTAGTKEASIRQGYEQAVARVDQQFRDVMQLVEERGALENAIVVVLSDHGESLGERDHVRGHGDFEGPVVFGHGTNVLSMEQYRVLFSMRAYGNDLLKIDETSLIEVPASLEDLAPTLLDLLNVGNEQSYDGWSLWPVLSHEETDPARWKNRIRFIETEYDPPGFSIDVLPNASEIQDAAQAYELDPVTDRLSIRPESVAEILIGRQFAAISDGAMLAALPNNEQQFLVFLDSEQHSVWYSDVPDGQQDPHARRLWDSLVDRFETVTARPIAINEGILY